MFEKLKMRYLKFQTISIGGNLRSLFKYSSVVTVDIDDFKIGLVYRFVQFFILAYIIGYSVKLDLKFKLNKINYKRYELLYKKGYQSFDVASGTVTTKVKGFGVLPIKNLTIDEHVVALNDGTLPPNLYTIFDTADYIIPPNEFNSIFVMTNFVQTVQTPGVCEEVSKYYLFIK
jgi:P2X purinoceptor 4